ncbi:hypothetical protein K466DRAFT_667065 [Polyporus arcularius HHB13444]|uniref:Uncharacterized protein n=1 Tax=Polyporus arcularius HHB13444 TaxID=1314778 RepID=A0A5C3NVW4_9APHY|nr:hypothetical protein K466DRAFT_667065 [Polyporus arcularius HHB13444]
MAPSPPATQFETFFPAESDVHNDIALLSYLLANVKYTQDVGAGAGDDARESKTKTDPLRAWKYLAFILTTGEGRDGSSGNRVVAVTGQVENGALTAAVVTRDVQLSPPAQTSGHFAITQVESLSKIGRDLLLHYDSTSIDVPFSQHVSDVFSILKYLFSPTRGTSSSSPGTARIYRTTAFALFISRRCYRTLRARVLQGTRIWSRHPLELIHDWYTAEPRELAAAQFALNPSLRPLLAVHDIHPDAPSESKEGTPLAYTISTDSAEKWVRMLRTFLDGMLDAYRAEAAWTTDTAQDLYEMLLVLHNALAVGIVHHLISGPTGLAEHLDSKRLARPAEHHPLEDAILNPSPDTAATSGSASGEDQDQDEGPDDPTMSVTRYLQTLCIAYEAADFYTSYGQRMASQRMQLQAYTISCKPSIPDVTAATVREFANRFVDRFPFPDTTVDAALETLAASLEKKSFDAAEHPEAVLMALACSSMSGTVAVEGVDSEDVAIQFMFRTTRVPVGVSEKCCFCCHELAELLKRRAGVDCVLPGQGTHPTVIFPWIPPPGLPPEVLVELRLIFLRVLHSTIETVLDDIRSAQPSSADPMSPAEAQPLHKSDDFRARRFTLTPDNSPVINIPPQAEASVGDLDSGFTEEFSL